jgi:hypothetical protein
MLGGLWGLGLACRGTDEEPSGRERAARSAVLRELLASREKAPNPQELQAQRRDLHAELEPDEGGAQGGSAMQRQAAERVDGTVEWVGDDELLVRDGGGVEREVRVEEDTRFRRGEQQVSRRTVEQGAEVRVSYDVLQGEWVAREVELLRPPGVPAPTLD